MKLAVLCLCILHLAFVSAGLFTCNDLQTGCSNVTVSRAQAPERKGSSNQGKHRTLFARRGQYERQRIRAPKPKVVPVPPKSPPPPSKVAPDPAMPKCSLLAQSCLPQSGCCDPCATCHCRFFNTICFCRRTNPQLQEENIRNTSAPKLRDKKNLKCTRS